jgi:hypothetical protein
MDEPDLTRFLRSVFVDAGEFYPVYGSESRDGRFRVQSSVLAAAYNAWRGRAGLGAVSGRAFAMRMDALGAEHGIDRVRTAECANFVLDVARMRAALGGA